jgi:peptidyl-dipeptidase Dcp
MHPSLVGSTLALALIGGGAVHSAPATPAPASAASNPLLATWTGPDAVPPFNQISARDSEPAFEQALAEGRAAMKAIADNPAAPTLANTVEAMEKATPLLDRVSAAFFTVAGADATPAVQAIEERITPSLTRFQTDTYLDPKLYARVDRLWQDRARLDLAPEQARLLEIVHLRFTRAGAALAPAARARMVAIEQEMAGLRVKFSQAVLADQKAGDTFLSAAEMAGVPDSMHKTAAAKAKAAGRDGFYLISSTRSDVESFLSSASNRAAREQVFKTFNMRGDNGNANDTNRLITSLVRLRLEKAKLLGYRTHADYVLADSMARTPAGANALLTEVYEAARRKAAVEEADLLALARADGIAALEPWDWRYYAEKLRQQRYALDEADVKRHLPLDGMVTALFQSMQRLYGVTFTPRPDVPAYAPGVRVWEVKEQDGRPVGLFYADWFARDTKRPGAWMNELRTQNGLTGARPIVVNNANFIAPPAGGRATLSYDDAKTMFHEFGHAIHGLLSRTRYPSLAGTAVYRDFVEFPSQFNEHWLLEPATLKAHALDEAGNPLSDAAIAALVRAQTFNQGFLTVQQLSSAIVDMRIHSLGQIPADFDPRAFERQVLTELKVPHAIGMRHRLAHFTHLFDGGYDAGYYAYTWAEVLEADAFDAFRETGNDWDPATAARFRAEILERGNSRDPALSFVAFRGRGPKPDALLRNRGLDTAAPAPAAE